MVTELENLKLLVEKLESDFTTKENATDTLMVTPRGLTSNFSDGSDRSGMVTGPDGTRKGDAAGISLGAFPPWSYKTP